jgi:phosphoenolpyruvate synthase/pyruvate phosphate dikinase
MNFVKPLNHLGKNDLPLAGGKAANLGVLLQAGFPVPPGFCITTNAYRAFIAANHLDDEIQRILPSSRLETDQVIYMDGSSGRIEILGDKTSSV